MTESLMQNVIQILLLLFVGISGALFISIYFLNHYDPYYVRLRKIVFREDRKTLFKDNAVESAHEMANQRRESIRSLLIENSNQRFLPFEFLELPPQFEPLPSRSFEGNEPDAIAQMIRLNWQLDHDELLLAERVVDAVFYLVRREQVSSSRLAFTYKRFPIIKLEPVNQIPTMMFPWRVVIETNQQEFFQGALVKLRDWFSIGIEFAPESTVQFEGRCIEGYGM